MAFLVFEGLDGSGKTTLIRRLHDELTHRNIISRVTREPGGTQLGDEIREVLLRTKGETPHPRTEILLYEAIRAQHVESVIRPALDRQEWVLCDRFTASTLAFQTGGRKLSVEDAKWLNSFATAGVSPDLTVLLDLPVNISASRRQERVHKTGAAEDRFEREKQDFHERVRHSYLAQAHEAGSSWFVLDAQRDRNSLFNELVKELVQRKWLA